MKSISRRDAISGLQPRVRVLRSRLRAMGSQLHQVKLPSWPPNPFAVGWVSVAGKTTCHMSTRLSQRAR